MGKPMTGKDDMGDRMKSYEKVTDVRLDPKLPIIARIDGRSFSKYTKGFLKPFDPFLINAMQETAKHLVAETHAKIGYTQSDEITLIFQATEEGSSILFDGRVLKLASVLASMAAVKFDRVLGAEKMPAFDCRVYQVPTQTEAANALLWRAMDARKNSVSSACRAKFSTKQMFKKDQNGMREMLSSVGVDFDTYYTREEREGTYYRRENTFCETEKGDPIVRGRIKKVDMPYFSTVKNRVEVIFYGEEPRIT